MEALAEKYFKSSLTFCAVLAYSHHLVTFSENTRHVRIRSWFDFCDNGATITLLFNLQPNPKQPPRIIVVPRPDAGAWQR